MSITRSTPFIIATALIASCSGYNSLKIINKAKLASDIKNNPLGGNTKTLHFTNELSDHVFTNTNKTSAIAPTEVLMNYLSVLQSTNNVDANISALGFSNGEELVKTYKEMQSFLNFKENINYLRTSDLIQTVEIEYNEDELKNIYEKSDINVIESSLEKANQDVKTWFSKKIGINIDPVKITDPGIYAHNVTNLKDSFAPYRQEDIWINNLTYSENKDKTYVRKALNVENEGSYYYDEKGKFRIAELIISKTSLYIILPDEGKNIGDISFVDIDLTKTSTAKIKFKIPLFKVDLQRYDLTNYMTSKLDGARAFDKIFIGDSFISASTNTFELTQFGIKGQSITTSGAIKSAPVIPEKEVIVNRPFYAISYYKGQPLFNMKVINL